MNSLIYKILFGSLLKKLKKAPALVLLLCLTGIVLAQSNDPQIADLVRGVEAKAKKTKLVALNEYQSNFKRIVEFEGQNKTSVDVYEEYCYKNDKTFCRIVQVEKDGVPVSAKKIEESRKKVAKDFIKNNKSDAKSKKSGDKEDPFGYGISINSQWVDPVIYLRACRIFAASESIVEGRKTLLFRANNCNIDNEPAALRSQIRFMTKTEAEIWIDEEDKSVARMKVYPGKEFVSISNPNDPIIITENLRMPDGYWLSKRTRLEAIGNKEIFPNLKDNLEFEFFGYQRLTVNVDASKPVSQ